MTGKADAVREVSQHFKDRTNAVIEGVMVHLRDDNAKEILGPGLSPLIGRGSLKSIVTFALYADVLRMVRDMVMADGEISDEEVQESLGLLSVLAGGFAKVRSKDYSSFVRLTFESARRFLAQYSVDNGLFGHANEATKWAGVELCHSIRSHCDDPRPLEAFGSSLVAWADTIAASDEMAVSEVSVLRAVRKVLRLPEETTPKPATHPDDALVSEEADYTRWRLKGLGSAEWLTKRQDRFGDWLSRAKSGHPWAQVFAGLCYEFGQGVDENKENAVRWYQAAADQGHPEGMVCLGSSYEYGDGVEEDKVEAVRCYRAAAETGNADAMFNLGFCYHDGTGVEGDEAEALRWFRAAADRGHARAMFNIGVCYARGSGVEEDEKEAVRWYRAAADQGDSEALFMLGFYYANGKGVEEDKEQAVRWYRAAADQGNPEALFNLGVCYSEGEGVSEDKEQAFLCFQAAAHQNNANALFAMGVCHERGEGVAEDRAQALRFYQKAAALGHREAQSQVELLGLLEDAAGQGTDPWGRLISEAADSASGKEKPSGGTSISVEDLTTLLGDVDAGEDDTPTFDEDVPPPAPSGVHPDPPNTVTNSIGMKFVLIHAGEFQMGLPADCELGDPSGEEFQHPVRITKPFLFGMHQVTQAQYERVTATNPSFFNGRDLPVEHVSWKEARGFCKQLSELPAERTAGRTYRLPTEAEWEYACRSGTTTLFNTGDTLGPEQARFAATSRTEPKQTAPVGTYPPNAWGLFDMHGNVWEWTNDWFSAEYYRESPVDDPQGPATGTHHTLRGGSASMEWHECRTAYRGEAAAVDGPETETGQRIAFYGDLGIRVVCDCQ